MLHAPVLEAWSSLKKATRINVESKFAAEERQLEQKYLPTCQRGLPIHRSTQLPASF